MALTRHEQLYYNNIERIADALEALVAQGKQSKSDSSINRLSAASNLLYGNMKSPLKNNPGSGRSEDNYTYPEFVKKHYEDDVPDIVIQYQNTKGGDFPKFWASLTNEQQTTISNYYDR